MKNYISIVLFFSLLIISSCSVEQPEVDLIVTEYPEKINEYVINNYSSLTIVSVVIHDEEEYEVELNDMPPTILIFDLKGNFIEVE